MMSRGKYLAALFALVLAGLSLVSPQAYSAATVDRAVCSSADKAGGDPAVCSGTELVDSATQEIAKLYHGNILVVQSVGGSANAITGSTSPAATALVDGEMRQIKPASSNTSTVTYNDNGLGAKQVVSAAGSALSSGDLQSTTVYILRYYQSNDEWRVLSPLGTGGSAPSTASYVTLGTNATLSSERVLTAGTALGLTDAGAGSTITVALTDAELTCLAALTSAADKLAYYTGSGTCALADLPSYARTLIDDTSASAARTTLGLVIGTDVQAYDADLAALAANSTTGFWAYTGAGTGAARTLTAPAAGFTISNGAGTAGNPTFALANDLAALEALSGTNNIYYRSASETWTSVTIGGLLSFSGGTLNVGDAELAALAGLTSAADTLGYFTGSGTASTTTLTSFGRSLIDDAASINARTTLGLVIGTDVQAFDAELAALAGLTSAADTLGYFTGSGTASTTTLTSFGRSLIDDAASSNARTTLGLVIGTDVQAYNARLADVAGITWDQGDILYFNGTNLVDLGPGTSGQFLKTNGAGANPAWATLAGGGDLLSTNNLSDVANASTARTNLGLAIGTNVQAYDADLTTWAGVTPSANGQSLVAAANYAAMRALLDLEAGTDFYSISAADAAFISPAEIDTSAEVRAILGDEVGTGAAMFGLAASMSDDLSCTGSQVVRRNSGDTAFECATVSGTGDLVAANNLSDVANAATARTNLGLGTGNSPQFTGIEVGNASDTTLTRSAAGIIAVEGKKLSPTESFCVAASDEVTAITTGTAKVTFRMPYAFTLTDIRGSLNTVSSSGSPIIDVNEAGTTLMTTNKVLIDVSENTSVTAVTAATLTDTSLADDAEITVDVDTAGTGAKGLKICLIGYQT